MDGKKESQLQREREREREREVRYVMRKKEKWSFFFRERGQLI
jgi:hypothetical protein